MVGVLVRLKLCVLRHSLHGRRAVLFALGAVYGLVGGVASALLPPLADPRGAADLTALIVLLWALGWIAGPIALGGGDETIRPENFALLPIRPTALARGMAVASLLGVAPVATLIAFTAHVWIGLRGGALATALGVVGLVLELALVVLLSRVVVAALSAVLTSRRGQDVGVLLAALGAVAFLPLQLLFRAIGPALDRGGGLGTLGTVARALPTGWAAVSVEAGAEGDPLLAVAPLVGLVVLGAVLVVVWGRLLERRLTVAAVSAGPSARSARAADAAGPAARSPVRAVVSRELSLWRRDARRRSLLLSALVLGVFLPVVSGGGRATGVAYAAIWLTVFATTQLANLYGQDGGSIWHLLVVGGAARADVRGRQIAWFVVVAPVVLLAAVVGPVVAAAIGSSEPATAAPWLAGLVPVLLGAGSGLVVLQSAYIPMAQPQGRGANPFGGGGAGGGAGCVRGLSALAFLLLLAPPALPVLVLLVVGQVVDLPALSWAATPVGVVVGVALAWWWGLLAQRRLEARGPEILAEVRQPV